MTISGESRLAPSWNASFVIVRADSSLWSRSGLHRGALPAGSAGLAPDRRARRPYVTDDWEGWRDPAARAYCRTRRLIGAFGRRWRITAPGRLMGAILAARCVLPAPAQCLERDLSKTGSPVKDLPQGTLALSAAPLSR